MTHSVSSIPAACCPITARHWLPKTATAIIPVIGIVMGAFLEDHVRKETPSIGFLSTPAEFQAHAESLKNQNHYKIAIIVNALVCIAATITCVALGIFAVPSGGIGLAIFFGGFAAAEINFLYRDISHIRDLENGINPWAPKS